MMTRALHMLLQHFATCSLKLELFLRPVKPVNKLHYQVQLGHHLVIYN